MSILLLFTHSGVGETREKKDSFLSQGYSHLVKCKQLHPEFEFRLSSSFTMMKIVMLSLFLLTMYIYNRNVRVYYSFVLWKEYEVYNQIKVSLSDNSDFLGVSIVFEGRILLLLNHCI